MKKPKITGKSNKFEVGDYIKIYNHDDDWAIIECTGINIAGYPSGTVIDTSNPSTWDMGYVSGSWRYTESDGDCIVNYLKSPLWKKLEGIK